MSTNVTRPKKSIESTEKAQNKEGLTVNIAYNEIKKLKKLLKTEPKSLWKYLQKKEN
jgi:hypothetical protein